MEILYLVTKLGASTDTIPGKLMVIFDNINILKYPHTYRTTFNQPFTIQIDQNSTTLNYLIPWDWNEVLIINLFHLSSLDVIDKNWTHWIGFTLSKCWDSTRNNKNTDESWLVTRTREMCIVVDNWHNKNNATEKVFVTNLLYVRIREEPDLSEYGSNVMWLYTISLSI